MPWDGPPKWSGERGRFGPLVGKLFPVVMNEPFCITIEGCDDFFFMLFSDEEKLKDTTEKFLHKLGTPQIPYTIGRVTSDSIFDTFRAMGIRFMCDPVVIDDHHTKWLEVVKVGEEWKYADQCSVDPSSN